MNKSILGKKRRRKEEMMKGVFLSNQVFKQTIMNTTYGNVIGADTMENSMEVPQKSKRRTTI